MLFNVPIFTKLVSVQYHSMKMSYIKFCPNKKKKYIYIYIYIHINICIKHNPNFIAVIKFFTKLFLSKTNGRYEEYGEMSYRHKKHKN